MKKFALLGMVVAFGMACTANAQTVVNADIAASVTWDLAGSPYMLEGQVYVTNGATLTINPGVVVASDPAEEGSLAVTRGSQIRVMGTAANPVVMTSTNDDRQNWREAANEWGNLTVMGNAIIGGYSFDGAVVSINDANVDDDSNGGTPAATDSRANTAVPNALNRRVMEGLTTAFTGDPRVLFGGGDDDDDSGEIHYLSIRYTGKVLGLGNELNGLSLGGIGRATDIDHVEIMNNVDDGIEIWGGTVNLEYCSIWNIGDDSFDIDQGWRGNAQYVFIVQGYALDAKQGSGIGDNCFETDGAEDADAQPVTTACIYNATVIGQPEDGDKGTAFRDNARVQYRRCIFMDLGGDLVGYDGSDGDGGSGYDGDGDDDMQLRDNVPVDGTLNWDQHWTTAAGTFPIPNASAVAGFTPADLYTGSQQTNNGGTLCEIRDSVFWNIADYGDASRAAVGVVNDTETAGLRNNVISASQPIASITRIDSGEKGPANGLEEMRRVVSINPSPVGDALSVSDAGPTGTFFDNTTYRGAFSPKCSENWLRGWSAASEYGFLATQDGDLTGDCVVNVADFVELATNYLNE